MFALVGATESVIATNTIGGVTGPESVETTLSINWMTVSAGILIVVAAVAIGIFIGRKCKK